MGLALGSLPRASYQLSTKVGRYLRPHADETTWDPIGWAGGLQNGIEFAYTYDDVMRQYEDSLQRLGVGRIDCLVIHDIEEAEGQRCDFLRIAANQAPAYITQSFYGLFLDRFGPVLG